MLLKLQKRFSRIIMIMVGTVLALMLMGSVVVNGVSQYVQIQADLETVLGAGDSVDLHLFIGGRVGPKERAAISERPVYVVAMPMDGSGRAHAEGNTAEMDEELLSTAVSRIFPSGIGYAEGAGKEGGYSAIVASGIFPDLGVVYAAAESTNEPKAHVRIAFADSGALVVSLFMQAIVSLAGWLLSMVALYFISRYVSRLAIQPTEDAWNKQRQFVADASHELKTPLSIILANNSILQTHPEKTAKEQYQWLESTEEEANRMNTLVSDLLLLAQIENAEERTQREIASILKADALPAHREVKNGKTGYSAAAVGYSAATAVGASPAAAPADSSAAGPSTTLGSSTPAGSVFATVARVAIRTVTGALSAVRTAAGTLSRAVGGRKRKGRKASLARAAALPVLDLSALVERSLLQFDAVFFERGLAAESTIEPGLSVAGNGEHLRRLIDILLDNASKYSSKGGAVLVSLSRRTNGSASASLTVSNTGSLIPPDKIKQVFERFFRVDDAHSTAIEGSGLGLSLAQAITTAHGGSISVTSTPLEESTAQERNTYSSPQKADASVLAQTTFSVRLPLS